MVEYVNYTISSQKKSVRRQERASQGNIVCEFYKINHPGGRRKHHSVMGYVNCIVKKTVRRQERVSQHA